MSIVTGPVQEGCVFCGRINEGDVQRTDLSEVHMFEPLNPVTPGHMLFVSDEHIRDASQMPYYSGQVFEAAAWYARMKGDDFNLITSGGSLATQTVWHFHVHYVPRREGDGLLLPWSNQKPLASKEAIANPRPYSLVEDGPQ